MKYTPKQTERFFLDRYEELGLSQTEVAEKSGIQPADLTRYKKQRTRPRLDQLAKLVEALEIDVISLLVALGALDTDSKAIPKVVRDGQNTKVIWNL